MTTQLVLLAVVLVGAFWNVPAGAGGTGESQKATLTAWEAVPLMTPGINIGNTLENTHIWETGWGNPPITRELIRQYKAMGFKSIRLPVAWDTYADNGKITDKQFARVSEVVDWILDEGLFCVVNIHWDGGWIDSGVKEKYPDTYATFSPEAERKFRSYWQQIATHFAGRGERLLFEGLNEETNFDNEGSEEKAYATLTKVNQIFVDTVRATGGNNAERILIVAGYKTDITNTLKPHYKLPKDTVPGRLMVSLHYYTPWTFVGLDNDASWGKMRPTWGTEEDFRELNRLFDGLAAFSKANDIPIYLGEFSMASRKEKASAMLWTNSVFEAILRRGMVPVLWDTGGALSRRPPYTPTPELLDMLKRMPAQP